MARKALCGWVAIVIAGTMLQSGCAEPACKMHAGKKAVLPSEAEASLQRAFPGATIEEVKMEDKGIYEVELQKDGAEMEAEVTAAGMILETSCAVAAKDLPKAVQDAIAKAAPGAKIEEAKREETLADAKTGKLPAPQVAFEVELAKDGKEGELKVAADGTILDPLKWEDQDKDDEKEGNDDKGQHEGQDKESRGKERAKAAKSPADSAWQDSFAVDKASLSATGENPYLVLKPGHRLILAGGGEQVVITVLDETQEVDGVTTRVVEERETQDGRLVEVSRNFLAIDPKTLDVYYFGEDVDMYKDGKSHVVVKDAWRSGVNGAKFGLLMPGKPKAGQKYMQEIAPKVAMDRAEVVAVDEEFKTPAGAFRNVLRVREGSALEKGREDKLYAPGVGQITDGKLVLTKVESAK